MRFYQWKTCFGLGVVILLMLFGTLARTRAMPLGQLQDKPTPMGGWPTVEPNLTPAPVIVEQLAVALTPVAPTPTPTRIPDDTPPQTGLVLESGAVGLMTITFVVTDDLSGLGFTEYKLDEAPEWTRQEYYYPPLVVNGTGVHTLVYRSLDKLFNTETVQTTTFKISQ